MKSSAAFWVGMVWATSFAYTDRSSTVFRRQTSTSDCWNFSCRHRKSFSTPSLRSTFGNGSYGFWIRKTWRTAVRADADEALINDGTLRLQEMRQGFPASKIDVLKVAELPSRKCTKPGKFPLYDFQCIVRSTLILRNRASRGAAIRLSEEKSFAWQCRRQLRLNHAVGCGPGVTATISI